MHPAGGSFFDERGLIVSSCHLILLLCPAICHLTRHVYNIDKFLILVLLYKNTCTLLCNNMTYVPFLSVVNKKLLLLYFYDFYIALRISKTLNLSLFIVNVEDDIPEIFEVFTFIACLQSVVQENLCWKKTEYFYERLSRICIIKKKGRTKGRNRGLSRNLQLSTSFAINFANLNLG